MRTSWLRRGLLLLLVLTQILAVSASYAAPPAQGTIAEELAQALLARLTPEERVGQLFVVEFEGSLYEEDGSLARLISERHIGGVNLKASNNNFSQGEESLADTWLLIQQIQQAEISTSLTEQTSPFSGESFTPAQIPLFIGIRQPGGGSPEDQISNQISPLPSQMAIGATWDPALAQQAGELAASELSSLGFNFLLGPSLNVHSNPRSELVGDLGVSSYSGSPYWVGKLGQAYITGLHAGSNNKMAVIGMNFPGYVGADQPLQDEIPTIRKTFDQLLLSELPPFFTITDLGEDPSKQTDGLLLAHARYEAFQSNISSVTPPISLDPQALGQLLSLEEFSTWHANGGLIVSDELGSQAIRRYYVQVGQKYDPRLISRDALLAGNDLLLTGNFIDPDDPDLYTSIVSTLDFFAQKYRDDVAFAQLVDEAVLRILTLKYNLYNNSFQESNILSSVRDLDEIGIAPEVGFEIARQGATLINLNLENLTSVLPNPPASNEFITIFTDSIAYQACQECPEELVPAQTELENAILRLYGPSGADLVSPGNIASYTFSDLDEALNQVTDPESLVIANIQRSAWLVFLQMDRDPNRTQSFALSRFLSETPELIQDRNIIVFGADAPYFLNATEVSTVTAYYGLYSKQPQFIEVAARLLFKELNPAGSSPVTIDSVGYVIEQALTPNPAQTIPLEITPVIPPDPEDPVTDENYSQGDNIIARTGVIMDYNGNPVRDDTLVRFILVSANPEGVTTEREITALTSEGAAQANILLDTPGTLRIQASSGQPAAISEQLQIDITGTAVPTPPPDETPAADVEPTPTEVPVDPVIPPEPPRENTSLVDWLLAIVVIIFLSLFAYQFGALAGQVRWGVRYGLTSMIGGLLVNAYLSFDLPGAAFLIREYQVWGIVLGAAGGCLLGWAAGLLWRRLI